VNFAQGAVRPRHEVAANEGAAVVAGLSIVLCVGALGLVVMRKPSTAS